MQKILCGFALTCCVSSAFAQTNANAKNLLESSLQDFSKKYPITYTCKGDDSKASCVIPSFSPKQDITFENVRIDASLSNTKHNYVVSANISSSDKGAYKEMLPKELSCKVESSLNSITLGNNASCLLKSPIYSFAFNTLLDFESASFKGKNINEVTQLFENIEDIDDQMPPENATKAMDKLGDLKDLSFNPKFYKFSLESEKLADYIVKEEQKTDPNITKDQYNAAIAMGVAAFNLQLSKAQNITPQTIEQITKASEAIASLLTSNSKKVEISLKRKNQVKFGLFEVAEFISQLDSNPQALLESLNNYEISVSKR